MCLTVFSDKQVREMLPWAGFSGGFWKFGQGFRFSSIDVGRERNNLNPTQAGVISTGTSQYPFLTPISISRRNCPFIWSLGALYIFTVK